MIKSFSDLEVYQLSYKLAVDVFNLSITFPQSEKYSLTDQIVRSTRSISANIAEGFGRKTYPSEFKKFLVYSAGSLEETKVWLNFAKDCQYITSEEFDAIYRKADEVGAKIHKLYIAWK
ncbi:four helix bundle protein [Daejeonella sp.]|uniref:four helix bundle protein n=1 Tax=Daejeonella sp. TaxID=2805397 RepID=UPI0039832D31